MNQSLFIHWPIVGCFQVLANINKLAFNILVPVFVCICLQFTQVNSKESDPQIIWQMYVQFCKTAKLSSKELCQFAFPPTINENSCFSCPCKHLVFSVFGILAILRGIQWYLVLFYDSLMIYDVEHILYAYLPSKYLC